MRATEDTLTKHSLLAGLGSAGKVSDFPRIPVRILLFCWLNHPFFMMN